VKASDFKIKTHAGNSAVGGYWASISGPGDFFELIGVPHTKDSFETRRQVIAAAHARIGEVIEDADNK
jgi:hypothetical protein